VANKHSQKFYEHQSEKKTENLPKVKKKKPKANNESADQNKENIANDKKKEKKD
jgi:hypothetical protein